jgi:hypothetical protein
MPCVEQFAEWVEARLLVWLKHHFRLDLVNVNVRVEEDFEGRDFRF